MHIFVVTVGILIAFSFDGIREGIRERRLVKDARESFQLDVREDQTHLRSEKDNLRDVQLAIGAALAQYRSPHSSITGPLPKPIEPGFYFFRNASWDTALSTGALGHMNPEEVSRYADMRDGVRTYTEMQWQAINLYLELETLNHLASLSSEQAQRRQELLAKLQLYLGILQGLADQFSDSLDKAANAPR